MIAFEVFITLMALASVVSSVICATLMFQDMRFRKADVEDRAQFKKEYRDSLGTIIDAHNGLGSQIKTISERMGSFEMRNVLTSKK